MQIYMRVCPICSKENIRKTGHSKIYVPGWIHHYKEEEYISDNTTCSVHHDQKLIKKSMTCGEFKILRQISNEPSFMEAMNELKEKDIIEYNLKLSQFKSQVGEQKSESTSSNDKTKCPKCGHTEFTPVRKKWSIITGFMTNKVELICNNCGTKVQK